MTTLDIRDRLDIVVKLLNGGDAPTAERHATACTSDYPDIAEAWFLLGVANHLQKKLSPALVALERAHALNPHHIQVLRAKAAIMAELGQFNEALTICRRAFELAPDDVGVITNLATALEKTGRLEEALEQFDQALTIDPEHFSALLNRGALLMRMRRLEEALDHNRHFIQIYPACPDAYYNLSKNLFGLFRHEETLPICEAGLAIAPNRADLHLNRGIALAVLQRFEESERALTQAQVLNPNLLVQLIPEIGKLQPTTSSYLSAEMVYLEVNAEAQQNCQWKNRTKFLQTLTQFIALGTPSNLAPYNKKLAFTLLGLPIEPEQHLHALRHISEFVQETASLDGIPPFRHTKRPNRKIRVGYVSPDFRNHPTGYLTKDLYALHDRSKFEIYGYSLFKADDDAIQQEIAGEFDYWRDLSKTNSAAAAQQIYRDEIDILIDLAGYTNQSRTEIFALRPAPLQVNYLGYPGTMGASFIDYLIGDPIVTPLEHSHHFSEQLALMPNCYLSNSRRPHLMPPSSRDECGLPENSFVFCGFNQAFKITPEIFDIWMSLLHDVPNSILWLLQSSPVAEQNLRREAQARGINADRLIFAPRLPWLEHLTRFQHADLMLDTMPCNAHTTASDALWAGVPIITCMGQTFASRVAASTLHAAGLQKLVTNSLQEYAELALRLAKSPDELSTIRETLIATKSSSALFDIERYVNDLESLYERIYRTWELKAQPKFNFRFF